MQPKSYKSSLFLSLWNHFTDSFGQNQNRSHTLLPSTSFNWQRYQVISLSLERTFHQDVFTLTEWVRFCRPWAWSFLELSINSMLDLRVLARIFFRCILASIALLQPDLGHLEASSEPGRFNRVVVYSPTWECIQCIQCHCVRCSDISYTGATATARKVRCSYEMENAKQMHGQQCKLVSIDLKQ